MRIGVAKTLAIWLLSSNSSGVSNFRGIADISEQVIAFSVKIMITNMKKNYQTTMISGATILHINQKRGQKYDYKYPLEKCYL